MPVTRICSSLSSQKAHLCPNFAVFRSNFPCSFNLKRYKFIHQISIRRALRTQQYQTESVFMAVHVNKHFVHARLCRLTPIPLRLFFGGQLFKIIKPTLCTCQRYTCMAHLSKPQRALLCCCNIRKKAPVVTPAFLAILRSP